MYSLHQTTKFLFHNSTSMMEGHARFYSHIGLYAVLSLVALAAFIMIPITVFIMYHYCKNKAHLTSGTAMFRTGFCYFLFTLIFCINYCGRLLNECFGQYQYDYLFACSTAFLYGTHFVLLIYLLFCRLYYVFKPSAHKLSKSTICIFMILCSIEVIDVISFITIVYLTNDDHIMIFITYSIGVINIIVITVFITTLYIYKLFQVIKDNPTTHNEPLLNNITKYTVLALIWISTAICFWCIPYAAKRFNSHLYTILYHAFMLLDVSANDISFMFGYGFADKLYKRSCSYTHSKCKLCFICLVEKARPALHEAELNLSNHIKDFVNTVSLKNKNKSLEDIVDDIVHEIKDDSVSEKHRKSTLSVTDMTSNITPNSTISEIPRSELIIIAEMVSQENISVENCIVVSVHTDKKSQQNDVNNMECV
eukprot:532409_1